VLNAERRSLRPVHQPEQYADLRTTRLLLLELGEKATTARAENPFRDAPRQRSSGKPTSCGWPKCVHKEDSGGLTSFSVAVESDFFKLS
jgi:hypothetical protein